MLINRLLAKIIQVLLLVLAKKSPLNLVFNVGQQQLQLVLIVLALINYLCILQINVLYIFQVADIMEYYVKMENLNAVITLDSQRRLANR